MLNSHDERRMLLLPLMNLIGPNLANMTLEEQRNFIHMVHEIRRHIQSNEKTDVLDNLITRRN